MLAMLGFLFGAQAPQVVGRIRFLANTHFLITTGWEVLLAPQGCLQLLASLVLYHVSVSFPSDQQECLRFESLTPRPRFKELMSGQL